MFAFLLNQRFKPVFDEFSQFENKMLEQNLRTQESNLQIFSSQLDIKFRLREPKSKRQTAVYMYCRIANKSYKIMTQVRVIPEQWSESKQMAYTSDILSNLDNYNNLIVNDRIKECERLFSDFKSYLCDNPLAITQNSIELLKDKIYKRKKGMAKKNINPILYLQQRVEKAVIKDGTKRNYLKAINYLKTYCETNKIELISLQQIDINFLREFREWLCSLTSRNHSERADKLSISVVNNQMTILKTILRSIEDEEIYDISKSKILLLKALTKKDTSDNEIALSKEEVQRINDLKLTGDEAKIRDAFLFQLGTGQRFSEIKNFKTAFTEIDTERGKMWQVVQEKTQAIVTVPQTQFVKDILKRNNGVIDGYNQNTRVNTILKDIAKKAKIDADMTISKQTIDGIKSYKCKRYELIETHTARRTFITLAKATGMDDKEIMSITGHKTRQMIDVYNKVDRQNAADRVGKAFDCIFFNVDNESKKDENKIGDVNVFIEQGKKQGKQERDKDTLEEAKNVLAYLGADAITVADITNIDEANRLIYSQYERELTVLGIDYHIIKDLYNDNSKTTLRDKRNALMKIVKAIKKKE